MDRNAYSDDRVTDQPDAYWRRRVITLAAGLGLIGLLAWAFSGGGGRPARPLAGTSPGSGALPAAAYSRAPAPSSPGTGGPGTALASPAASGLASPVAQASGVAEGRPAGGKAAAGGTVAGGPAPDDPASAGSAPGNSAAAGTAARSPAAGNTVPGGTAPSGTASGGSCPPDAVVLSVFSSRPDYYGGQLPQFTVYAVSTAPGACSFDVGPDKLHVTVMSSGRIIWDSADCPRGEPNRTTELSRGVPVQKSVTWNRTISLPGCVTLASWARPGRYQVQAKSGPVASPVRTFKLVR